MFIVFCEVSLKNIQYAININHVPEAEKGLQYSIGYQAISSLSLSTLNEQTYPLSLSHNIALHKESCVLLLMNQIDFTTSTRMFIIVLIYQAIKFIILALRKAHTKDRTRTIESLSVNDIFLMPTE